MGDMFCTLLQLTESKHSELLILLDKTIEQQAELNNDNIEEIDAIADFKQMQIDTINEIDQAYALLYRTYCNENKGEKTLVGSEMIGYEKLQAKRTENAQIMHKIHAISDENIVALSQKMKELERQITQVNTGKKGMNAYTQNSVSGGVYIDQKIL
ncbi:MAG: hypothetical protein H7Y41_07740 [Hyphomonadaceae bacterium]|nr:hypothetical protein [Clostridia bacterium]